MSTRVLGAIMAGGRSRRFGSDKADAGWNGKTLLAHCIAKLAPQVEQLVVCGRIVSGFECLADRPEANIGPLGALCAALHHAARHGFAAVLSVPVDVHPLPDELRVMMIGTEPAVLEEQTAIGWWPAALAGSLDRHISDGARSLESWIIVTRARRLPDAALGMLNINRPGDLEQLGHICSGEFGA